MFATKLRLDLYYKKEKTYIKEAKIMLFCKCYFHHNANICWAPPRRNDNKCVKRYLQLDRYLYCLNWKHLEYTLKIITSLCFCATSLTILFVVHYLERFQGVYWWRRVGIWGMIFFSQCSARACLRSIIKLLFLCCA
mgnify:CR=1 FL=1